MSPAKVVPGEQRGFIIPVGGGEAKLHDPAILRRFVKIAGGRRARVAIIPTASLAEDTGRRYEGIFRELGADVPLHFTAFHPDHKLDDREATPPAPIAVPRTWDSISACGSRRSSAPSC